MWNTLDTNYPISYKLATMCFQIIEQAIGLICHLCGNLSLLNGLNSDSAEFSNNNTSPYPILKHLKKGSDLLGR